MSATLIGNRTKKYSNQTFVKAALSSASASEVLPVLNCLIPSSPSPMPPAPIPQCKRGCTA